MLTWPTVLTLGAGSYLLRLLGLTLLSEDDIPPWAQTPLRLLPPAILAALIVTMIITPGEPVLGPRLLGVLAAVALLWRRVSLAMAMLVAAALTGLVRLGLS